MFTGLVQSIGKIRSLKRINRSLVLNIGNTFDFIPSIGDSIAVDGCCLTVESASADEFSVFATYETLKRTCLNEKKIGSLVNLEPALAAGDRMGGHIVQGHVDCLGKITRFFPSNGSHSLSIQFPSKYLLYVVAEGSVSIDGISLTVKEIRGNTLTVSVIPETIKRTTLNKKHSGQNVNIEFDVLAKYSIKNR